MATQNLTKRDCGSRSFPTENSPSLLDLSSNRGLWNACWQWMACCAVLGGAFLRSGWSPRPSHTPSREAAAWQLLSVTTVPELSAESHAHEWFAPSLTDAAVQEVQLPTVKPGAPLTAIVLAWGAPDDQLRVELQRNRRVPSSTTPGLHWQPVISTSKFANSATASRPVLLPKPQSDHAPANSRLLEYPKPGTSGFSPLDYEFVELEPVWIGPSCRIWLPVCDARDARLEHWCRQLGELVTDRILPCVLRDQGVWPDVDGDGRINLVVTDRVTKLSPGVRAFVRKHDFQSAPDVIPTHTPWDVVHVQPGVPLEELEPILIHEFTHAAEFSWCQHLAPDGPWPIPDWLTEGLAHAAELRNTERWENTLPRLQAFAIEPQSCPLRVADATFSGLWRNPGQRGASAAFCDWWTRRYGTYAWPELFQAFGATDDPWQILCGSDFTTLFRDWSVSLATEGLPTGSDAIRLPLKRQSLTTGQTMPIVLTGTAFAIVDLPGDSLSTAHESLQIRQANSQMPSVQIVLVRTPTSASSH